MVVELVPSATVLGHTPDPGDRKIKPKTALEQLSQYPNWVCWQYGLNEKRKPTKIPKNPHTGGNAQANNPKTWGDYSDAYVRLLESNDLDGLAFALSPETGLIGIDLDDCMEPSQVEGVNSQLAQWAEDIINEVNSYSEISPSGNGIRIFLYGHLPEGHRNRVGDIEIYSVGRFLTFTENSLLGWTPDTIQTRQSQVQALYNRLFPPEPEPQNLPAGKIDMDDQNLIYRAEIAKNGAKFSALWRGDTSAYGDESRADMALCGMLAYWTANNADRMDRLFRASGLYRLKWDEKHASNGHTYGQMTIQKAIANTSAVYEPDKYKDDKQINTKNNDDGLGQTTPGGEDGDKPKYETVNGSRYQVENGEVVYVTYKTIDGEIVPYRNVIAPFVARITQKTTVYDDYGKEVIYKIEGYRGRIPFEFDVTGDEWADVKQLTSAILKNVPGKPPGTPPRMRSHWGTAMTELATTINEISAISSTGWSPDGHGYVMPGGSVGQGYVCQMEHNLQNELKDFGLHPQDIGTLQNVVNCLEELAYIYRPAVIHTLIAHAFLPPLLRFVGNEARYLYHIHAQTGSLKTELVKIIMSLYGPQQDRAITYKWNGTPYGAESRANALKDCLMLIDDLKPGTISETDKAKWVAFVQAAVDAQGRKRATIGGKAGLSLPPRAVLLSTGEAVPEAGEMSYTARMLLAETNIQPSGRNQLLDDIKNATPTFSGLMYGYIAWLIEGQGQGAIDTFKTIQAQLPEVETSHARLMANYAANRLGAVMYVKYCQQAGLMSVDRAKSFLDDHEVGLLEIVNQTASKASEERYSNRFILALDDAISTGFANLSLTLNKSSRVGWQDDAYTYLLSGAKEIVDQWLRASGQSTIQISKRELAKQLYDDGHTHSTQGRIDRGTYDYQVIDPATDKRIMVLAIKNEPVAKIDLNA